MFTSTAIFFFINSHRIDTLVKFYAVATEFFYVDGQTDMLKLIFTFRDCSVNRVWFKQLYQSGN